VPIIQNKFVSWLVYRGPFWDQVILQEPVEKMGPR
jgi:hypothetical protein